MDKQLIQPGEEPRKPRGIQVLLPGEPLWIESGKSRTVQLTSRITRVSIADPAAAGVVVLGPRTLTIIAKPLPERAYEEESAAVQVGGGTLLGATLTRSRSSLRPRWSSGLMIDPMFTP